MTGTEWYASIFALAESPFTPDILWTGSDDGLIHISRDRAKTWTNVTPSMIARFTRISIIEASHFDQGTAYIAANRFQLDDFRPYLFKTTDFGKTWTKITTGIPDGAYTRTIREDPVRRGLLYAGTETGVYFSIDDGAHWQPLQLNLPRASVRDLRVHGNDLIAATHGRAMWSLDNVSVLRQLTDSIRTAAVHLFKVDTVTRFQGGHAFTSSAGENPFDGVTVDYWLKAPIDPKDSIRLEFADASGKVIRKFASAGAEEAPKSAATNRELADTVKTAGTSPGKQPSDTASNKPRGSRELQDDTLAFTPSDSIVTGRAGLNRFWWDLHYPDTKEPPGIINDEGSTRGPLVSPGRYTVRLITGGRTYTQPFIVRGDPRVNTTQAEYDAQLALALQVQAKTNEITEANDRILTIQRALDQRTSAAKGQSYSKRIADAAKPIKEKLEAIRDSIVEIHSHADQITLHYPVRYYNMLLSLAGMVQSADSKPTDQEFGIYAEIAPKVDAQLARLRSIEATDLAAFNALMRELNVPAVTIAAPPVVP
jgi:hypothetical protein